MIEPTTYNVIKFLSLCGMLFFWGMSTEVSDEAREKAKIFWWLFMAILWVFIIAG